MWILVVQQMIIDLLWHLVYFPVWWYTSGFKHALLYCFGLLKYGNGYLAPGLWIQNLFVPMFGQSDWQGRIVSVFMRFVNIIGRGLALLIWTAVVAVIFSLWLVWPIFVVYLLYISF